MVCYITNKSQIAKMKKSHFWPKTGHFCPFYQFWTLKMVQNSPKMVPMCPLWLSTIQTRLKMAKNWRKNQFLTEKGHFRLCLDYFHQNQLRQFLGPLNRKTTFWDDFLGNLEHFPECAGRKFRSRRFLNRPTITTLT